MKDIIQIISNLEDLRFIKPASETQIRQAEEALGLRFADDYRAYVSKYGVISARGIELTGVTQHQRLSVVAVTQRERAMNADLPGNLYVIENVAIDGILALQDATGAVYTIAPHQELKKCWDSLAEYVESAKF